MWVEQCQNVNFGTVSFIYSCWYTLVDILQLIHPCLYTLLLIFLSALSLLAMLFLAGAVPKSQT